MDRDCLEILHMDQWSDLQTAFKQDWPRGVSGYWALDTQRLWAARGIQHDVKVHCPFGDVNSGMVIINNKKSFHEVIIQCPNDDTTKLEEALRKTKIIEWDKTITVPFPPQHIIKCLQKLHKDINMQMNLDEHANELFLLDHDSPEFKDNCLPDEVVFKLLADEDVNLVDSSWVNRHETSPWYFQLLIKAGSGYGLFKNNKLACWVFINEVGALTHLYTLENYRKKGYAEALLKLVCNKQLKEDKDIFAYCRIGNKNAFNLYTKLGFKKYHTVLWCELRPQRG